jgi:hypothetical protein
MGLLTPAPPSSARFENPLCAQIQVALEMLALPRDLSIAQGGEDIGKR